MTPTTIKLSLHLNSKDYKRLHHLKVSNNTTKSNLLRKGLDLIELVIECKKKGNHLIVVDKNELKVGDVFGI